MIIEPAIAADAPSLAALVNSAYRGVTAKLGWSHEADLLDGQRTDVATLTGMIGGGTVVLLVMRERAGAPPSGCVSIQPAAAPATWSLGMLTIDPVRQTGGLGRALLSAAEDEARRRGATTVRMTVIHRRETLIAWYERRDYIGTGETEPFPYGNDRFGIPLRKDLHFVVLKKNV